MEQRQRGLLMPAAHVSDGARARGPRQVPCARRLARGPLPSPYVPHFRRRNLICAHPPLPLSPQPATSAARAVASAALVLALALALAHAPAPRHTPSY